MLDSMQSFINVSETHFEHSLNNLTPGSPGIPEYPVNALDKTGDHYPGGSVNIWFFFKLGLHNLVQKRSDFLSIYTTRERILLPTYNTANANKMNK